jgi:hypothetical protein
MTTFFQYQERIGLIWCKQIEGSERHRSESRLCQSLIESWLYRLPPVWLVELHYRQHPSQLELCYQLAVWTSDPNPKMNVGRATPTAGAEREVRDLRRGAHRTGDAARGRGAVRSGSLDRGARVSDREAGGTGGTGRALAASVPGRPRQSLEAVALEATRAEVERCGPPSPSRWWRCTCTS